MSQETIDLLIVEDDEMLREALLEAAEDNKMRVYTAKDGFEALLKAQSQRYDAILVDMNLPKKMGDEVVDKIRTSGPSKDSVIVVLSGYLKKEVVESLVGKVDKAFTKPADIDQVIETIKTLVSKKIK